MDTFSVFGGLIALLIQLLLCLQILSGRAKQNFTTWILWAALDGITAATIICQSGNYLLPLTYATGSFVVAMSILKYGDIEWTWFESFVAILVAACIMVWIMTSSKIATIAGTTAVIVAGLPQLRDTYIQPWKSPLLNWIGFTIANGLSVLGGKDWSIEERLYPSACTGFCIILVIITIRRYWIIAQDEGST